MKVLPMAAALLAVTAFLAPAAGAAPTAGMSERGLLAYGRTLQAEAAQYRAAGMSPAGLAAYGQTLRAEAAEYGRTATAAPSTTSAGGFSWVDALIGAAVALACVAPVGYRVAHRPATAQ